MDYFTFSQQLWPRAPEFTLPSPFPVVGVAQVIRELGCSHVSLLVALVAR